MQNENKNEKICENEDRIDNHDHQYRSKQACQVSLIQSEYHSIAPVSENKNFEMNEMGGKNWELEEKSLAWHVHFQRHTRKFQICVCPFLKVFDKYSGIHRVLSLL